MKNETNLLSTILQNVVVQEKKIHNHFPIQIEVINKKMQSKVLRANASMIVFELGFASCLYHV